jgi:hypothetical protein
MVKRALAVAAVFGATLAAGLPSASADKPVCIHPESDPNAYVCTNDGGPTTHTQYASMDPETKDRFRIQTNVGPNTYNIMRSYRFGDCTGGGHFLVLGTGQDSYVQQQKDRSSCS